MFPSSVSALLHKKKAKGGSEDGRGEADGSVGVGPQGGRWSGAGTRLSTNGPPSILSGPPSSTVQGDGLSALLRVSVGVEGGGPPGFQGADRRSRRQATLFFFLSTFLSFHRLCRLGSQRVSRCAEK